MLLELFKTEKYENVKLCLWYEKGFSKKLLHHKKDIENRVSSNASRTAREP